MQSQFPISGIHKNTVSPCERGIYIRRTTCTQALEWLYVNSILNKLDIISSRVKYFVHYCWLNQIFKAKKIARFVCLNTSKKSEPTQTKESINSLNPLRVSPKMVKYVQRIRRLLPMNCLSVFDHFVGLALKLN